MMEKIHLQLADTTNLTQTIHEQFIPSQTESIQEKANQYVDQLFSLDLQTLSEQESVKSSMENFGVTAQRQAARQSAILQQPISTLSQGAKDGGEVANALIDLKVTVESLDPSSVDFEPGWFSRLLGLIPGVGNSLKRYFIKFESAQTVIQSIIRSLEMGQAQLERDNLTLQEDQKLLWESTENLKNALALAENLDQKISERLSVRSSSSESVRAFIAENVQFSLRQRIMDIQQQLAVQQQAIMAIHLIVHNNKELCRGVERALNVTITALQVGTTVALALAHQKKVIDKVNAINDTTSQLIQGTAARLKQQGTDIHKQAASAMIDIKALKNAFADLNDALQEVTTYRLQSVSQMATTISELNKLLINADKRLQTLPKEKEVFNESFIPQ